MFLTFAFAASLFSNAHCQLPFGNLSTTAYATPKPVVTSSTRGLGEYILAAFGVTSSISSSSSSNASSLETYNTLSQSFSNASTPAYSTNATAHARYPPLAVAETTSSNPRPSTVCYSNNGRCFTDITYSAISIEPTGTGSAYASRCAQAISSYSSASTSWESKYSSTETVTTTLGGPYPTVRTYYKDAITLCDGHPRVSYSPAISISTATVIVSTAPATVTTYTNRVGSAFPLSNGPTCSINPTDCNALYSAYETSLSKWSVQQTGGSAEPKITQAPEVPPCTNSSDLAAYNAADASLRGCGPCTIFGDDVQLVYFPVPTTVSRDMCAMSPSSPTTWYDKDVVSIYNGSGPPQTADPPLQTVVYNGHTFTSGTAYISIKKVWTSDRCTASATGAPVTNAILAMPSESVLSLRGKQDHFQYWFDIKTVTGYPFNFADLNEPVPYSAYVGQQMCEYEQSPMCSIIYDGFNPQLAMPPGIRKLRPEWENCQMWYGGLYDPPMALHPVDVAATPTLPVVNGKVTADPSSTIAPSTPLPTTALMQTDDNLPDSAGASAVQSSVHQANSNNKGSSTNLPAGVPFTTIAGVPVGNDPENPNAVTFGGQTLVAGGAETVVGGDKVSVATDGLVVNGNTIPTGVEGHVEASATALMLPSNAPGQQAEAQSDVNKEYAATGAVVNVAGQAYTFTQGNGDGAVGVGGSTMQPNGQAATINGVAVSALSNAVVVDGQTVSFSGIVAAATQAVYSLADVQATAYKESGSGNAAVIGSATLSEGGSAITLAGGQVASLASDGIVVNGASSSTTIAFSDASTKTSSSSRVSSRSSTRTSSASKTSTSGPDGTSDVQSAATTTSGAAASHLGSIKQGHHWASLALACCLYLYI